MKYRMYIDEVGNSDLNSSDNPLHRYLSLTGVIVGLGYVRDILLYRQASKNYALSVQGFKLLYYLRRCV